jgi:hypothetical protein
MARSAPAWPACPAWLSYLGLVSSARSARFTVRLPSGRGCLDRHRELRRQGGVAGEPQTVTVPLPLYLQRNNQPYCMTAGAFLTGQPTAEQHGTYGDDSGRLRLPHYGVAVQYTTAVVNDTRARYGVPDVAVAPTLHDWLTGTDPVLAARPRLRACGRQ